MKWALVIKSKHTRERSYLGTEYETAAEALAAAAQEVCERCNTFSVIPVDKAHYWAGRREGWKPK